MIPIIEKLRQIAAGEKPAITYTRQQLDAIKKIVDGFNCSSYKVASFLKDHQIESKKYGKFYAVTVAGLEFHVWYNKVFKSAFPLCQYIDISAGVPDQNSLSQVLWKVPTTISSLKPDTLWIDPV